MTGYRGGIGKARIVAEEADGSYFVMWPGGKIQNFVSKEAVETAARDYLKLSGKVADIEWRIDLGVPSI